MYKLRLNFWRLTKLFLAEANLSFGSRPPEVSLSVYCFAKILRNLKNVLIHNIPKIVPTISIKYFKSTFSIEMIFKYY
jgi:hypothetical protein